MSARLPVVRTWAAGWLRPLIGTARGMGLRTLEADTWKNNMPMFNLCQHRGFHRIELFPDSAAFRLMPHVAPVMAFAALDLDG